MFRRKRSDGDDNVVIDLTAHVPASDEVGAYHALLARRWAEGRREDAARELAALRDRYWSGERLLEEHALDIEFWEHALADPYAVLGLTPDATLEEAAAARKRIARQSHPDVAGHDPRAAARMQAANNAYERLRQALRTLD